MSDRVKLVIVGGGAAGLLIAMKLAKTRGIEMTLIDYKTFYEYTPALCSVLFEKTDESFVQHFKSITFDYEPYLTKLGVKFVLGKVKSIQSDEISLMDKAEPIQFDYAVICTGSSYAEPWKTMTPEETKPSLSVNERFEYLSQQRQRYKQAQDILCIGGGPVGVETVMEIAYRSPTKSLTLIDTKPIVLSSAPGHLGSYAQKILQSKPSIRLINEEKSEKVDNSNSSNNNNNNNNKSIYVTDKTRTRLEADLVYNCIGVTPNSNFIDPSWLDDKKQVRVNEFFQVTSVADGNVYALGDVSSIEDPKMFYTAHIQAVHFANNMQRILKSEGEGRQRHKTLLPYHGVRPNMVVSMGPTHAVAHVNGLNLTGWPICEKEGSRIAAWTKHCIERITMNDFGLKVPANTLLYYTQEKSFGGILGHKHSS
ncbi:hypothetical protein BDF20DRAFT_908679 [Mycotypha africana]|uniref:uncharacterized protein n=1 Tax=Mycotypha africana TaxID=64632 RepID=UPI002301469C|nr:uncharacterized protein BDF20DRAFT_908679 [Mycotypha africana]KAI8990835.1 hypothetical protein BDF20DRAFT_908679 [Mycotypha africana]